MYKLFLNKQSKKTLDKLPDTLYSKISTTLDKLEKNPHSKNLDIKELHKPLNGFRCKVWPYRILCLMDDKKKEIFICRIFHRGKGY